jgi:hypothetical protein
MRRLSEDHKRWCLVVAFALGMAWVEAASVYYLRTMTDRLEPYQEHPLPIQGSLGEIELVREAATLLMLLTVGMLSGRTPKTKLGYSVIAFGVWDIFYYAFLRLMCGWPRSLLDWDVLFLLPLPWWGPVLAPVSIALLMILWGTCVTQLSDSGPATAVTWTAWGLSGLGIVLALYVFMADSLWAVRQGMDVKRLLPTEFNWPVFAVALILMAMPVAQFAWRPPGRIGESNAYGSNAAPG